MGMYNVCCEYGLQEHFFKVEETDPVKGQLAFHKVKYWWANEIWNKPKLSTYYNIAYDYFLENYILYHLLNKKRNCSFTFFSVGKLELAVCKQDFKTGMLFRNGSKLLPVKFCNIVYLKSVEILMYV